MIRHRRLEGIFARHLEDVLKTSWKRVQEVLKTYGLDEYIGLDWNVLKTSSEDEWLRRIYSTWLRRLLRTKTRDIFKTPSSRRMFSGILLHQIKLPIKPLDSSRLIQRPYSFVMSYWCWSNVKFRVSPR